MNLLKVIFAGGMGLVLGMSSMATFGQRVDPYAVTSPAQSIADGLGGACNELINSGEAFIEAIDDGVGSDWTKLTDTTLIANDDASNINVISDIENQMSTAVQSVGCKDVTCTLEVFDTALTSISDGAYSVAFTSAQEDGDVALMCVINPISASNSCDNANMDGVTFMLMPVSQRKDIALYGINPATNIGYRASGIALSYEIGINVPNSGTTSGLSENEVQQILGYLSHGSRCGTNEIKVIHSGNAVSPFVSSTQYWTPY